MYAATYASKSTFCTSRATCSSLSALSYTLNSPTAPVNNGSAAYSDLPIYPITSSPSKNDVISYGLFPVPTLTPST